MHRPGKLGLAVVALAMALTLAGCDWTMDRYGPAHTGFNSTEKTIGVGNVSTLTRRFTAVAGGRLDSPPAIYRGVAYIASSDSDTLYAFDAAGNTNCSGVPKTCMPLWTALTGGLPYSHSTSVVDGIVYVSSVDKLYAFDAAGTTNCSGSPKSCSPLWTATAGASLSGTATVANGIAYVGSTDDKLYAFDAAGSANCSGVPKTCSPLWSAQTDGVTATPTIANGVVYTGDDILYAFDAAGNTNCSGVPKTCSPLWTTTTTTTPGDVLSLAIAGGVVYVNGQNGVLYAFDAAGNTNCSGTPKTCAPLWIADALSSGSPAVANGVVYVGGDGGVIVAFDAAGNTNCSGTPKICGPIWTGGTLGASGAPTIANGVAYILAIDPDFYVLRLYAFDAAGTINCQSYVGYSYKGCTPLASITIGGPTSSSPGVADGPVVANGIVYVPSDDHNLYAYALP